MQPPLTTLFTIFVVRPIRAAHRVFGDKIWPPLELLAGGLGSIFGAALRPLLRSAPDAHPLEPVMRVTNLVESSLGIQGTDEYGPGTVRRLVHHCPFAEHLRDTPDFCMRLGFIGGQKAFSKVLPAAEYAIRSTKSQGAACCEYSYWLKDGQ